MLEWFTLHVETVDLFATFDQLIGHVPHPDFPQHTQSSAAKLMGQMLSYWIEEISYHKNLKVSRKIPKTCDVKVK